VNGSRAVAVGPALPSRNRDHKPQRRPQRGGPEAHHPGHARRPPQGIQKIKQDRGDAGGPHHAVSAIADINQAR
jgi:hypothetical protein